MSNRLAGSASPYLLQHADNPVEWQPWDDTALAEARRRDVPILLSIGYAACHWCHVMEHESFSDPATAKVMNTNFVCIKVDREERPDLDAIYMEAVQAMTGSGGWPMTVFLLPDGKPFFGGTYFPPQDRHGLPAFRKVLTAIAQAWRDRRDEVLDQASRLGGHLDVADRIATSEADLDHRILTTARDQLGRAFDPDKGGFGGAPKFPQPMTLDLLRRFAERGDQEALEMMVTTLDAMAAGGMFDQLAGGFARYSVDATWTVPHFEKMLYDNALLLRTYARSAVLTGSSRHAEVARATAGWMLSEMRDPGGGFYSSLDADSEGEEGRFYVWSLDEVRAVTGVDFDAAVEAWGFTAAGNFEGRNIPVRASQRQDEAVRRARAALLARRATRVRPATDDKVLAAWNGYAISALATAGVLLDEAGWVRAAAEAAMFVLDEMRVEGRLVRSVRLHDGTYVRGTMAFCEDYAALLEATLALLDATGEKKWADHARWAADEAIGLFGDQGGLFFATGRDAERLVSRPRDIFDNAVPSSNSVLAMELQRLALITGESAYDHRAQDILQTLQSAMERSPLGFAHLLEAADMYLNNPIEVVVVGEATPERDALVHTARRSPPLDKIVLVTTSSGELARLPLIEGRGPIGEAPAAYPCSRGVCRRPVTDPKELVTEIAALV